MADATTRGPTNGLHEDAQSELSGQAQKAQEKAQEVKGQAQERLRSVVDERSTQAGEQVSQQASDLRSVAEHLRGEGKNQPAKLAEQAADRAERLGGYLSESSADRILSDIEDFGRKQPWAVALGGLALGFAASRFLKASSAKRYESRSDPADLTTGRAQIPARTSPPATTPAPSPGAPLTASPVGTL
jgi:uncharacterized protein YjbJ (UPF0337 family)